MRFLPRYSLRTLMIVVTVAAVGTCLGERHVRFKGIAALYTTQAANEYVFNQYIRGLHEDMNPEIEAEVEAVYAHFDAMHVKYQRAARYPWLPVERDPSMLEKTATH